MKSVSTQLGITFTFSPFHLPCNVLPIAFGVYRNGICPGVDKPLHAFEERDKPAVLEQAQVNNALGKEVLHVENEGNTLQPLQPPGREPQGQGRRIDHGHIEPQIAQMAWIALMVRVRWRAWAVNPGH
jgi:hypothetical protein